MFGAVAAAGGFYCWAMLPETKGRSLAEVQALLAADKLPMAGTDALAGCGSEAGARNPAYTSDASVAELGLLAGVDAEAGRVFAAGAGEGVRRVGLLARMRQAFAWSA